MNHQTNSNGELPAGWRWVRLGELCVRIDYGFTASADFSVSEPRFLRITDIQNGQVHWEMVPGCKITDDEVLANRLRDGDIVFARTGATTGKSFLIQNPPLAVFASYLIRLRVKSECDPEFLSLFFQGPEYWQQIRIQARGGAQPNFNASMLAALNVRLPPLAEQRRIAGRLREQLAEVAKARTAVQAQLAAAQALPAAALREVFDGDDAHHWPTQPFGDVVVNCDGRRIPLKQSDRANRKGPYPYYGASGVIDFVNEFLFDGDFLLIGEDGANLISRSTPIAFKASGKFWVNNHAHVIQPRDGVLLGYLEYFFAITDLKPFVTGSAQPKLSQASMNEIPVPVPPLDVQRSMVATPHLRTRRSHAVAEVADREVGSHRPTASRLVGSGVSGFGD